MIKEIILTKEVRVQVEVYNHIDAQNKANDLMKMFGYDNYVISDVKRVELDPTIQSLFNAIAPGLRNYDKQVHKSENVEQL